MKLKMVEGEEEEMKLKGEEKVDKTSFVAVRTWRL